MKPQLPHPAKSVPEILAFFFALLLIDPSHGAYESWQHSRSIYLNTKPSGAGVTSNLNAFPVLVRLDTSTFDFFEALHKKE